MLSGLFFGLLQGNEVDCAIRTEHLTKVYAGRVIAVNDLTFEVPRGSVYGLLGPNGAGKTTTLRLLLGLQRPTAGRAEVLGHRCGVNATSVRSSIGYLPTHPTFPGHLRPIEYLDLLGKLSRMPAAVRKPRLASLLRAVGLLGATEQRIRTFSTGMRTRLGIAASLLADPPLLIWDEPTAGLDPAARRFTLDLIAELARTRTVVVATHILSDIDQICDHVGVMHEGRMIFSGSMRDVKQRLRRDDFCLELDGPVEGMESIVSKLSAVEGVQAQMRDRHTLVVHVENGVSRAGVMAKMLQIIDAAGLTLHTIGSGQSETEYAYLQLLHEDSAHGFRRFDFQAQAISHADPGDLNS
ncbi:MAG: ABC transporter ATP-binding protein [Pirellulaceae bacterium]